jgi:site-specific DNA recombinase
VVDFARSLYSLIYNTHMDCAIYARCRADSARNETNGVERQLAATRRFAETNGWNVAGDFVDRGTSSTDLNRHGLTALLAYCKEHAVAVVVVDSIDRLARLRRDYLAIFREFERNGVTIRTCDASNDLIRIFSAGKTEGI